MPSPLTPHQRLAFDMLALAEPMDEERSCLFAFIGVAQTLKEQGVDIALTHRTIRHSSGLIGAAAMLVDGQWLGASGSVGINEAGKAAMKLHGYKNRWKYLPYGGYQCFLEAMDLTVEQEEQVDRMKGAL